MDLLNVPLGVLGAFAGVMLWSHVVKILFGALAAAKNTDLANLFGELTDQKIRKIFTFLFAATCVWITGFSYLAVHFLPPNPSGAGWSWFFGGMATTPLFVWATTLKIARKIKQRRAGSAPP